MKSWMWIGVIASMGLIAEAGTLARFRTPLGDVDVELLDEDKPVTVRNFLTYVQEGRYRDSFFHRWVPNFVVQGGGFMVRHRGTTNSVFDFVPTLPPIVNEYSAGRTYSNTYGTLAMARVGGQTNSASSQWFFNLKHNVELDGVDGGFTVFGRVIRGTNVLNLFVAAPPANNVFRVNLGSPLNELPVTSARPTIGDLVFFDVTLLQVAVERGSDGGASISWNAESNLVHLVEYTRQFPPVWTSLIRTNGNGGRMTAKDPASDPQRFYRVRSEP
ncbi:MAG: hypothetical protein FJ404_07605 [Verrucomicrobia bacterium]|nr:hypothetical protein [Verrucomicrobiota bacterium]